MLGPTHPQRQNVSVTTSGAPSSLAGCAAVGKWPRTWIKSRWNAKFVVKNLKSPALVPKLQRTPLTLSSNNCRKVYRLSGSGVRGTGEGMGNWALLCFNSRQLQVSSSGIRYNLARDYFILRPKWHICIKFYFL